MRAMVTDGSSEVARNFSVVDFWRVRRVSPAFRRWATSQLAALPFVLAVSGETLQDGARDTTAGTAALDLSTLRWSSDALPALPDPRHGHVACIFGDCRILVASGYAGFQPEDI